MMSQSSRGLDATDCSAYEDNSNGFISLTVQILNMIPQKISILFLQKHLNDLIREKAELLALRLKEQNVLEKDVKVSYHRKHNKDFSLAFKVEGPLVTAMILKSYFKLWV